MNYSRIILEAIMAMKRPPVTISFSGRVPEQDSRRPRLDFRGDGASLYVQRKISLSLNFLGLRTSYRRRGGAGKCWGATREPPSSPLTLLRTSSLFRVKTDIRRFSAHSENISVRYPWIFNPFREYFLKNFSEIQKQ